MMIRLFKNDSDRNYVNPILTAIRDIDGHLKGACNIINPLISLQYNANLNNCNYAYIPDFNRYYHINNKTFDNNTVILEMTVDVLKSHATAIRGSMATVTRTNKGNYYLHDNRIANTAKHNIEVRKLGSGFPLATRYVLTVASKG